MPRGRKCGCICPSCKASLIARKGNENEWHFAHDHRADDRPDKKCDISFESACRLFVIDLLKSDQVPVITTPGISQLPPVTGGKSRSRSAAKVEGLSFFDSEEYGDVKADIKGYTLEIFLDYPSRVPPEPPRTPGSTGVLAFPVAEVRRRYMTVRGGPRVLAEIVKSIFAEAGAGKKWLYHPVTQKVQAPPPGDQVKAEAPALMSSEQLKGEPGRLGGGARSSRPPPTTGTLVNAARKGAPPRSADEIGTYKCYRCHHTWEGGEVSGRVCPWCGSNRHSVFSPC